MRRNILAVFLTSKKRRPLFVPKILRRKNCVIECPLPTQEDMIVASFLGLFIMLGNELRKWSISGIQKRSILNSSKQELWRFSTVVYISVFASRISCFPRKPTERITSTELLPQYREGNKLSTHTPSCSILLYVNEHGTINLWRFNLIF